MKQLHQPFMSPSPWAVPSRRGGHRYENFFHDMEFWQDTTEFPTGLKLMTQSGHPERYEHAYWMSTADKTEMTAEWTQVYQPTYGGITMHVASAGNSAGFYVVYAGRYVPSQVAAGRTTNTDDWSTKYDGSRGFFWEHWTADQPSDSHDYTIASRPTTGSVNFGGISFNISRNYTYRWRIYLDNGDGSTSHNYVGGTPPDCTNDSCGLQWEFVKGSHVKLKMYKNVHNTVNFSTFTVPTWPIAETGYYVNIDLSSSPLNQFVPISPSILTASSQDVSNGRIARYCYELRGIGNGWETLV